VATAQPSNSSAPKSEKRDFRKEMTDRILKMLADGVAPWQKPWEPGRASMAHSHHPRSFDSRYFWPIRLSSIRARVRPVLRA
jgi:type IV secretory pathway protease TraF